MSDRMPILLTICFVLSIVPVLSAVSLPGDESETNAKAEQYFEKANELRKAKDYDAAVAEYEKVMSQSPKSKIARNAQYWIGQSHFEAGRHDAALAAFQKLLDEYPDSTIIPSTKQMIERVQQAKQTKLLIEGAKKGDAAQVELLISRGADLNATQGENAWTALLSAATEGHAEVARVLLANGANVDMGDSYGYTPLYYAIWSDDDETVEVLISANADVNKHPPYEGDYSALVYAIWQWRRSTVELILDAGADINIKEDEIYTPLYFAAFDSTKDVFDLILAKKDYPDTVHMAACKGDLDRVAMLIERGVDVNAKDEFGCTPLHWAAIADSAEVANFLIAKGANVNVKNGRNLTPLMSAHALPIVELLIAKGAAVNAWGHRGRRTPLNWARSKKQNKVVDILRQHGAVETLHYAAAWNNVDKVKRLISRGADVNGKNNRGKTPLHMAANRGHKEMVEMLIENGADIEAKDTRWGSTALLFASAIGRHDMAELLLSKGADIEARNNDGMTPLLMAVYSGKAKVAVLLLSKGADTEARSNTSTTPLHMAIKNGNSDMVKLLLSKGADLRSRHFALAPVGLAIRANQSEIVQLLISEDAEFSPVHIAAYSGKLAKVKDYLAKGGGINAKDPSELTLLASAICADQTGLVKFLIKNGADVNLSDNGIGWTALHYACTKSQREIVRMIIEAGADVNLKDELGQTPLWFPTCGGHTEIVELLLAEGADANVRVKGYSDTGYRPLHMASKRGYTAVAELLITNGADINAKTGSELHQGVRDEGLTPLHWSCTNGHESSAKLLIDKGANVNAKTKAGKTSLSMAQESGQNEIAELLRKHGAKE